MNFTNQFAIDVQNLDSLRLQAKNQPDQALKKAAQQFEALFLHMVLKSMRDTVPKEGLFDSEQTRLYTSLLDQQLSQTMATKSFGLAEVIVKQLSHLVPASQDKKSPQSFVKNQWDNALIASRISGIPPQHILGQAALESGWGRYEIRHENGQPSYNLFGIKAGSKWSGPKVETLTTEYVGGVAQKFKQTFRAYSSYKEAFSDYAQLLRQDTRYAAVLGEKSATSFAQNLQKAGYATDPHYADKLVDIISEVVKYHT